MGTIGVQDVSINRGSTVELNSNQSQELVLVALVRLNKVLRTLGNF